MIKKIVIIFLCFLVISQYSCKKQAINKLEGNWRHWRTTIQDSVVFEYWEFREPNMLFKTAYYQDTVKTDTGYWEITKEFLEPTFLDIKSFDGYYDGIYQILKLNKKYLFLQRTKLAGGSTKGAFLRLEFTKE